MNKRFALNNTRGTRLDRRSFLLGSGAVTVGVAFGSLSGSAFAQDETATAATSATAADGGFEPSVYVEIDFGGRVRILYQKAEMGQGVLTGLPMLIAEEMDADWANVAIERAPGTGPYGNQNTVGSSSTSASYIPMRLIGAQVRRVLLTNAAQMLGVPIEELTTEPNTVIHQASGRTLNYGEIAASGTVPETLPEMTEADLKSSDQFRLIGTDLARFDVPAKTDGTAVFGLDVELPEMLYGAMLRPPVAGEAPVDVDDTAARAVSGVVNVVRMPNGVGVIAQSLYAARAGVDALTVSWTDTAFARDFSSEAALAQGVETLENGTARGQTQGEAGDFANAARIERLTFQTNHVAHATMEPMNAVVRANEDSSVEVWAGVQTPNNAVAAVRAATGSEDTDVSVNVTLLGGGFGRRIEADYVQDATHLALGAVGRPVKLVWNREQDLHFDPFRPLTVQQIEAALDDSDAIIGWRHRILTQAYSAGDPASMETATEYDGFDFIAAGGGSHPYSEQQQVEHVFMPTGMKVGAWRAIGAAYMKYPIETMIDHIADIRGEDPLAYRLSMVPSDGPAARIMEMVADMAGWDSFEAGEGRALGFGYSDALGSHTACAADVSVDRQSGEITVNKIWAAIDCGSVVLPEHVEAMMESSIIYSLSPTLREYVRVENGVPQVTNFFDYQVMRQNDIPEIEVRVAPSGSAPTGVGEAGVPPLVPAVTNAVRRALGGAHMGYLPMLPEKVLEAINA